MDSLLLDVSTWDICLDASGNLAVAADPYALAQDVATSVRSFLGTVWYNSTLGVPWLSTADAPNSGVLGQPLNITTLSALMVQAAMAARPPTADVFVVKANCIIQSFNAATRQVTGQIQFTDNLGNAGSVSI